MPRLPELSEAWIQEKKIILAIWHKYPTTLFYIVSQGWVYVCLCVYLFFV